MDAPFDQPTRQFPAERYYPGRKMFGGRFVLERRLGRGGMGEVWLAVDGELGREIALKFAPSEVAGDPKCVAELRREVIAGLELSHPRIARVHDLQTGDGEAAISMEYVAGKSLSDLQAETAHGFFEPREIEGWIDDVKDALRYAHDEAKRTHRDVKPKNIMVDAKTGRAKMVDFGISKRISETFTRTTGTDSSGSLAYMSPQQMLGERNSAEDDWYSLGASVYELVTGAPPFFRGDIRSQIERVEPPTMGERRRELVGELIDGEGDPIPPEWEEWVARMLSKERGRLQERAAKPVEVPPLPEKEEVPPEMPKREEPVPEKKVVPKPVRPEVRNPVRPGDQGTGGFGEGAKVVGTAGRRLMTWWWDGLLWTGVIAVIFMAGMWMTYGFAELRGYPIIRFLVCEFMQFGCFTGWVCWVFRKHGRRLWKLFGTLILGLGLSVGIWIIGLIFLKTQGWNDERDEEYATVVVQAFFYLLSMMFWLFLGMRWMLDQWHLRLLIAGLVAAVVGSVIAWLSLYEGTYGAEPVYVLGALVVGAVFGGSSAWALVSSRKVRV